MISGGRKLPLPGSVDTSGDEAVRGPEKTGEIGSLLLGRRELGVSMGAVELKAVDLNGIPLKGSSHFGADGVSYSVCFS